MKYNSPFSKIDPYDGFVVTYEDLGPEKHFVFFINVENSWVKVFW